LCRAAAIHLARHHQPESRIRSWLSLYAPWFPDVDVSQLIEEVTAVDDDTDRHLVRLPSADNLGWGLSISVPERDSWGLTTIGAVNDTPVARKKRRKAKARDREAKRRRVNGATPRSESKARTKPWIAAGMSRASWWRKQKAQARAEINSCAPILIPVPTKESHPALATHSGSPGLWLRSPSVGPPDSLSCAAPSGHTVGSNRRSQIHISKGGNE
jgi:hypothetical protein